MPSVSFCHFRFSTLTWVSFWKLLFLLFFWIFFPHENSHIYCSCNLSSFDEVASWLIFSFSVCFPHTLLHPCLLQNALTHPHPPVQGWSVCLCVLKGLAGISAVLARPSQRQRSLAEFSHTGTEWDSLLIHTMGSTPSPSRNKHTHTHSQLSLGSSLTRHAPFSYPLQTELVCVGTAHSDSSSDALFPSPYTVTHNHTQSHVTHLLVHEPWPDINILSDQF